MVDPPDPVGCVEPETFVVAGEIERAVGFIEPVCEVLEDIFLSFFR